MYQNTICPVIAVAITVAGIPNPFILPSTNPFGKILTATQNEPTALNKRIVQETSMNEPADSPGIPLLFDSVFPLLMCPNVKAHPCYFPIDVAKRAKGVVER